MQKVQDHIHSMLRFAKYTHIKGREDEALEVLRKLASQNGRVLPDGMRLNGGEMGDNETDNASCHQGEQGVGKTIPQQMNFLTGGGADSGGGGEGTDEVKEGRDLSAWQVGPHLPGLHLCNCARPSLLVIIL